jgi:hypothetical protein
MRLKVKLKRLRNYSKKKHNCQLQEFLGLHRHFKSNVMGRRLEIVEDGWKVTMQNSKPSNTLAFSTQH